MNEEQKIVLKFAYKNSNTYNKYLQILNKLLPIRIYHEIVKYEDKDLDLSLKAKFDQLKQNI